MLSVTFFMKGLRKYWSG